MLIRLQPDPGRRAPQKIGVANREGWCALLRRGQVFVKRFCWEADALYPDHGSNNELYTAGDFLEMESLGRLRVLDPGGSATHVERWFLFRDVDWGDLERAQYETLQALLPQTLGNS
jgi:hypothetical protein